MVTRHPRDRWLLIAGIAVFVLSVVLSISLQLLLPSSAGIGGSVVIVGVVGGPLAGVAGVLLLASWLGINTDAHPYTHSIALGTEQPSSVIVQQLREVARELGGTTTGADSDHSFAATRLARSAYDARFSYVAELIASRLGTVST